MASVIVLSITDGKSNVDVVLNDPIGPTNFWTASQLRVLSASSGSWNQLTGGGDLIINDGDTASPVLVIQGINTHFPVVGSSGRGTHFGEGGSIGDQASVDCVITSVS